MCVDYKSCCIFERELNGLHTTEVVKALKSIFCDISTPDKIISDNVRYFVSEEFQVFTMQWSIQHITSLPRFPHGNAHAEKAVHIVKQIYQKAKWCQISVSYSSACLYQIRVGEVMMPPPMCSLVDN